ncbi:HIT domain-containing protein [Candidatus Woesebacteria bacterium]|nr:HIT domain-containing protein [Candidatus Woesebacteria bacterium]
MNQPSIFTKIIEREIPATIYFEDDMFIAIKDIHPMAPVHALLITKEPYETLEEVALEDAQFHQKLLQTARVVARKLNIQDNYKLVMNVGKQVQQVPHIHMHILGGWDQTKQSTEIDAESAI